jgi:hypothetical protein
MDINNMYYKYYTTTRHRRKTNITRTSFLQDKDFDSLQTKKQKTSNQQERQYTIKDKLRMAEQLNTNEDVIQAADGIQHKTKTALYRIQQQADQTEELGGNALAKMREQRLQANKVRMDAEDLNVNLDKTTKMQNSFDRWSGNWFSRREKQAPTRVDKKVTSVVERRQKQNIDLNTEKKKASKARKRGSRASSKVVTDLFDRENTFSNGVTNSELDDDTKIGFDRLMNTDNDIDAMLDEAGASLDRLAGLAMTLGEEGQSQRTTMDTLTKTVDNVNTKQAEINSRVKRSLTGRWRNKS